MDISGLLTTVMDERPGIFPVPLPNFYKSNGYPYRKSFKTKLSPIYKKDGTDICSVFF